MSIWSRIADAIGALRQGESLAAVFDRLRTPPEQTVAFTIAVVALGAKMAKADGQVTRGEVAAFREVFHIAPEDEAAAGRVFNLARQDAAGFEVYARRIGEMFGPDSRVRTDLIEGLFHIALADGAYDPREDAFLRRTATLLGMDERTFVIIRSRHVPSARPDPWDVLGVDPSVGLEGARRAWRDMVRETHPDRMVARGVPADAVRLAERRLIAANLAWEEISGRAA